ncbi:hypothetical protein GUJ93_ZPchr0002g26648 [Zizania palustris]|uniref:CCHC-type domain-containing protein n=1 Tax=Zizania palustris TaxID=103762 RepID=A0A8J5SC79_ZIZPA|nr:hypothetical protein GUJ93_ZPchr0002g26648 [Zizania palustris]
MLSTIGRKHTAKEAWEVVKVVPERYDEVTIATETLLDIGTMSVEEVMGRLRAIEQWHKVRKVAAEMGSQLLLSTKEEKMIFHMRRWEKEGANNTRGNSGGGSSSGAPNSSHSAQPSRTGRKASKSDQCHYCKKYRHWACDCRKKKREEFANLIAALGPHGPFEDG